MTLRSKYAPRRFRPRIWLVRGGLAVATLASAGLVASYATQADVTVTINGQVIHHRTRAATVGDVLKEVGVTLEPEDVVEPAPEAPLSDGLTITVRKAQPVALEADGAILHIRTQSTHPLEVLEERAITLHSHDIVQVDGQTYSPAALQDRPWDTLPTSIRVVRSASVTVIDEDHVRELHTTQPDVGSALDAAGIALYVADRVTPDFSAWVTDGMIIRIERSVPVTVVVDGHRLETRARGPLVSDALASIGIAPVGLDYTIPPLEAPLEPETTIEMVRVHEDIVIEREALPFDTLRRPDPDLPRGEERVIQLGVDGERERRVHIRTENGREVSRTVEHEFIVQAPIPGVIAVGTGPE